MQRRDFLMLAAGGAVAAGTARAGAAESGSGASRPTPPEPAGPYLSIRGSAWRLALADVDGDGRRELLYGAYDGAVRCIEPAGGALLWEAPLGGFPFAVAAGDVDGDGRSEVFAACADGRLYALDGSGRPLWTFETGFPLYGVALARLQKGAPPLVVCGGIDRTVRVLTAAGKPVAEHPLRVVACRVAAGDMDGDGLDEILAIDNRIQATLLKLDGGRLVPVWNERLSVPDEMRNWENPGGNFAAFSAEMADIDGDGRAEAVMGDSYFNGQAVMALRGDGRAAWLSKRLKPVSSRSAWYELYSTAFVRAADVVPGSPGLEVMTVAGGQFRLFASDGKLLGEANSPLGFTDLLIDGRTMYLGSSPNGDATIYRIDLGGDWVRQVESLERRGPARAIGESLAALKRQVMAHPGSPATTRGPNTLRMLGVRPTEAACRAAAERIAWLKERFPYPGLQPTAGMNVIEPTPPLDPEGKPWNPGRWRTDSINGTMSVERIVGAARMVEEHGVPTIFSVGHSCMPFITLETAAKMLQAAPRCLAGFTSNEDEDPASIGKYFRHFLGPLADLCARYGRKQLWINNKGVWWMSVPSMPEVLAELTRGERAGVFVPVTEDSNSRTPEINLMARLGLRQAGLVAPFGVAAIGDLFSYCRYHQWEYPKHGHPYLRLLVAQTLLGGQHTTIRIPVDAGGTAPGFNDMAAESVETFLHLVGKGLVFRPEPEEMAGLARVGIAVHTPPEKWLRDAHNGHAPQNWVPDPELDAAILPHNGVTWGNSPTPEHALQRVLLHKRRQFGAHVPATPYGPFAIVPAGPHLARTPGVEEWWHTDGISLWRESGPKLTGAAAGEALRASFEAAAAKLPFRVSGDDVFFQVLRAGEGYRLFAIDPGWLDPADRRITIQAQLPGAWSLRDLLSGETLPSSQGRVALTVPAGCLRILEATPA